MAICPVRYGFVSGVGGMISEAQVACCEMIPKGAINSDICSDTTKIVVLTVSARFLELDRDCWGKAMRPDNDGMTVDIHNIDETFLEKKAI